MSEFVKCPYCKEDLYRRYNSVSIHLNYHKRKNEIKTENVRSFLNELFPFIDRKIKMNMARVRNRS